MTPHLSITFVNFNYIKEIRREQRESSTIINLINSSVLTLKRLGVGVQFDPTPGKTTLKKPSLITVKTE